jgi:hypothetical protein
MAERTGESRPRHGLMPPHGQSAHDVAFARHPLVTEPCSVSATLSAPRQAGCEGALGNVPRCSNTHDVRLSSGGYRHSLRVHYDRVESLPHAPGKSINIQRFVNRMQVAL